MNIRQILKNAASNYCRMAVSILTNLLLTPLILHRLGADAYGLWTLTLAVAGYFSLVDLGITSAAIRYIAHYRALEDWVNLNRTIGSTLCCYIGMAVASFAGALIVAWFAPRIFHVSAVYTVTLRWLVLNVGLLSAIGFASTMPIQCVIAAQRLDALNRWGVGLQILVSVLSAIGVCFGAGVLWLAGLQLFSSVANGAAGYLLARRFLPQARFRPLWDKDQGKLVVSFASMAALISVASRVIYFTDTLVIATYLSLAAVATYAVALKFVDLMRGAVCAGTSVLGSFASEQGALGNDKALARIWSEGTKWSLVITLPLALVFMISGREIVTAWVGPKYSGAALVLTWLALGHVFDLAQTAAYQVLLNTGRHKVLAGLMITEAVTNLSLSIWLLHYFGIAGVAMGTSIPLIARCLFFYPMYMSRVTHLPLADYVRQAVVPPVLASLPALGIATAYTLLAGHHGRWSVVGLVVAVVAVTIPALLRSCMSRNERTKLKAVVRKHFKYDEIIVGA